MRGAQVRESHSQARETTRLQQITSCDRRRWAGSVAARALHHVPILRADHTIVESPDKSNVFTERGFRLEARCSTRWGEGEMWDRGEGHLLKGNDRLNLT